MNADEIIIQNFNRGKLSGGYLREIPKPHIRRYPNSKSKRTLTIQVLQYPGFPHYFVVLRGEHNTIWNSQEEVWQEAWDDKEGAAPYHDSGELDNYQEVLDWIEANAEKYFPSCDWKYELDEFTSVESGLLMKYKSQDE